MPCLGVTSNLSMSRLSGSRWFNVRYIANKDKEGVQLKRGCR